VASLLDFVERIRALQDLPPIGAIELSETVADDAERCLLATALGGTVHAVGWDDPAGDPLWTSALIVADRLTARRIGIVMGLDWRADPPAVRLPDEVADVAVAQHVGAVEADDVGFLRCWWIPLDHGEQRWTFRTPTDDLLPGGLWKLPTDS
jgi:hypothetical protein